MTDPDTPSRPRRRSAGRRPAGSGTREAIARAAREQFAELGYDRTSVRGIARAADVDPKLVHHFFGGKEELFAQVVQLPVDPEAVLGRLAEPGRESVGERFAAFVLDAQSNPIARATMLSIIRAAANERHAAERIRSLLTARLLLPLAHRLGVDSPELRGSMIASQVVGLTMARFVVKLPALSTAEESDLQALLAATIDAALSAPLPEGRSDSERGLH